jgi:hypothetical protein
MSYTDKAEEVIRTISSINKSNGYYYENLLLELSKIEKLPIIIYRLEANELFFRTRINESGDYLRIKDLSYPDPEYVKSYARVNKPLQQLFYCSENRPTSFIELLNNRECEVGDEISLTIACWQLVEPLDVVLVFNPANSRSSKYYQKHGVGYDDFITQIDEAYRDGTNKLFKFIGAGFEEPAIENKDVYMLTCAYSNLVFTKEKVEGIIYPSVPFGGDGFNVALFPKVCDENRLRLLDVMKNVMKVELTEDGHNKFVQQSTAKGTIDYSTSTISW